MRGALQGLDVELRAGVARGVGRVELRLLAEDGRLETLALEPLVRDWDWDRDRDRDRVGVRRRVGARLRLRLASGGGVRVRVRTSARAAKEARVVPRTSSRNCWRVSVVTPVR